MGVGALAAIITFMKGFIMAEDCERESGAMISQARTVSLSEKLSERQKETAQRLDDINRAREILKKNPDLEELLTVLSRVGRNLF